MAKTRLTCKFCGKKGFKSPAGRGSHEATCLKNPEGEKKSAKKAKAIANGRKNKKSKLPTIEVGKTQKIGIPVMLVFKVSADLSEVIGQSSFTLTKGKE